jgi:hypothetical protein
MGSQADFSRSGACARRCLGCRRLCSRTRTLPPRPRERRTPGRRRSVSVNGDGQRAAQRRKPEVSRVSGSSAVLRHHLPWQPCDCRHGRCCAPAAALFACRSLRQPCGGDATALPGTPAQISCSRLIARDLGPLASAGTRDFPCIAFMIGCARRSCGDWRSSASS